jgi:transcription-repair coupling factor (superfamily II helicase)
VLAGFDPQDPVDEHGEFCVRGGIVDFYPSKRNTTRPLEFVGDIIESIRRFDAATQRSLTALDSHHSHAPARIAARRRQARRPCCVRSDRDRDRLRAHRRLHRSSFTSRTTSRCEGSRWKSSGARRPATSPRAAAW